MPKAPKCLPRFASMLQASLDFDVEALEGLLIEQCDFETVGFFNQYSRSRTSPKPLDIDNHDRIGLCVDATQLTLDEDSCGEHIGVWSNVDIDWQQHSATLLQQKQVAIG
jgi:hypothetical protein